MEPNRANPGDSPGTVRAAMLAALEAALAGLDEPVIVQLISVRSRRRLARLRIDPPPPGPAARPRPDDDRDCHADILTVLAEAGRRLTAEQICADLQEHGWVHGDSTVRHHLSAMVRAGTLSNDGKARPPGYGPTAGG